MPSACTDPRGAATLLPIVVVFAIAGYRWAIWTRYVRVPATPPASAVSARREVDRDHRRRIAHHAGDVHQRYLVRRRKLWKIQMGSVLTPPAVKIVTMTSSNDRANASRAPGQEGRADRREGHVAERLDVSAPRSADASSNDRAVRRRRAIALL